MHAKVEEILHTLQYILIFAFSDSRLNAKDSDPQENGRKYFIPDKTSTFL
jgi:hypothetical protein